MPAPESGNPDFIATEILGQPTDTSITVNVVPAVAPPGMIVKYSEKRVPATPRANLGFSPVRKEGWDYRPILNFRNITWYIA
jgi:hypothetical protein